MQLRQAQVDKVLSKKWQVPRSTLLGQIECFQHASGAASKILRHHEDQIKKNITDREDITFHHVHKLVRIAQKTCADFPIREDGSTILLNSTDLKEAHNLRSTSNWGHIHPKRNDMTLKRFNWKYRECKGTFLCKQCSSSYTTVRAKCCQELTHLPCGAQLHRCIAPKIRKEIGCLGDDEMANNICHMLSISSECVKEVKNVPTNKELQMGYIYKLPGKQTKKPEEDGFWAKMSSYNNMRPQFAEFATQRRSCKHPSCKARLWYFSSMMITYVVQEGAHPQTKQ